MAETVGLSGTNRKERFRRESFSPPLALILALALTSTVLPGGCSSVSGVERYMDTAAPALDRVTRSLAEVRKYWELPLTDQEGLSKAVADFRKVLSRTQSRLDSEQPPKPCSELSRCLRRVVDRGRDIADLSTPFADYLGQLAPLATDVDDLLSDLEKEETGEDELPPQYVSFRYLADDIYAGYRSIVAPAEFREVNAVFGRYIETVVMEIRGAGESGRRRSYEPAPDEGAERNTPEENASEEGEQAEPEGEEQQHDEGEPTGGRPGEGPRKKVRGGSGDSGGGVYNNLSEAWEDVQRQITGLIQGITQSCGLKEKNQEFDTLVVSCLEQIHGLEEKYCGKKGK